MLKHEDVIADSFQDTDRKLYAWGDEVRTRADELGLPRMSGLAGMVRLQESKEAQTAARRGKRRKVVTRFGIRMRACLACRFEYRATLLQCPKCATPIGAKAVEAELRRELALRVHGTQPHVVKPATMRELSGSTAAIEVIVLGAPSGDTRDRPSVQTILLRRYLWQRKPSNEAETYMVRKETYKEWVARAVEYVAEKLAQRRGVAL
jgi:hypothetical protein